MKTRTVNLLLICVSLVVGRSYAGSVNLAWDHSTSAGVTGYAVYFSTNSGTNFSASIRVSVPYTNRASIRHPLLTPGRWYLAATADAGGVESDFSNEVQINVPGKPLNIAVQSSTNLTDWQTFYRLQINP